MKKLLKLFDRFITLLPYLIVFIYSLFQPSDPDLGWHLKYGEYFWQHGSVLRDNTFSTMMPNFHWANTSWLTDIIGYTVFHFSGFLGLTIASALIVSLTFFFFAKAFQLNLWQQTIVFPFVLYLEEPVNAISFRGQQIALLFVGILFYLLSLYEKKPKALWLCLPLFLVWAAVDGEFILGIALFGLWVLLYIFKKFWTGRIGFSFQLKKILTFFTEEKKEILTLGLIVLCSILVTFINPFGVGIHLDSLSHIGSPLLKDIGEYLPFVYFAQTWWNEMIVGIVLVFGLFILSFRGLFWEYLPILGGGLLLFALSLQIRRYAWPAYYLVFPLFAMTATFLKPDGKRTTKIASTFILLLLLVSVLWMRYPFTKFSQDDWNQYCLLQSDPCSAQSADYLVTHHLNHNLYSLYGWGGWLIWNYPQIKPSIDGRMHMWVENGYSAFTDYYDAEQNMKDIDKTSYDTVYMTPDKPVYNRLVYLTKQGKWKQVYADKYAGIFVRTEK